MISANQVSWRWKCRGLHVICIFILLAILTLESTLDILNQSSEIKFGWIQHKCIGCAFPLNALIWLAQNLKPNMCTYYLGTCSILVDTTNVPQSNQHTLPMHTFITFKTSKYRDNVHGVWNIQKKPRFMCSKWLIHEMRSPWSPQTKVKKKKKIKKDLNSFFQSRFLCYDNDCVKCASFIPTLGWRHCPLEIWFCVHCAKFFWTRHLLWWTNRSGFNVITKWCMHNNIFLFFFIIKS